FSLYPQFRVVEVGKIFSRLFGLPDDAGAAVLEELGLTAHLDKRVHQLSSGLRRRLFIAVSIIHGPELIMLDEPFSGLDPESVNKVSDAARTWRDAGKTVIISSHDLHELEQLVDDLVVLREGKVQASGDFIGLIRQSGLQPTVQIETTSESFVCDVKSLEPTLARARATGEPILRIVTRGTTLGDLYTHLHQTETR
ncbi:MAG: ATP-binding cassette domain-containing protein, partial [Actinomycetota bacterium]